MKSKRRQLKSAAAFTIVELIAVIAVIAILIGLLVPALSTVQKMAATVSQKAQFSTISIGLETFREDMGDYPESNNIANYTGAQRLAEAMVGLDGFGYHPASLWDGDLNLVTTAYDYTDPLNIAARKGPYLELDTANVVKISSIYKTFALPDTFVLADKFKTVKNIATGKKTGMPILYFKANTLKTVHPTSIGFNNTGDPTLYDTFIYSYFDNRTLCMMLSSDGSPNPMGAMMGGQIKFYKPTRNQNFTAPPLPHNNESFILLSAGVDGAYGTGDDVYNFEQGE